MKIGKLTQIGLREVWGNEESDFSPWLAENIDSLSDAVDLNLEIIATEQRVDDSNFEIDILCEDDEGNSVIIENQLGRTDHSHLGQVLTYLVNMEAETAIWVTRDPRQEHVNVVNWLNENSDKSFFLVKVEAYKIDDSLPAPFFSVICRPSGEQKKLGEDKKVINQSRLSRRKRKRMADTIIVPARQEGFERVFLGENCWYSIRIKESKIPDLKFIASYQVAPVSAITHVAQIKEIVPSHEEAGKFKVVFDGKAKKVDPIPLGKKSKVQGPAYCEHVRIKDAKSVDDLLDNKSYGDEAA